mmetsp:Transcript_4301/g.10193  ORF Transcript_4301/g.10193 Transcript_4301/m.10193 type:complete len:205 (-) Transcript_4301:94-708(-)
MGSKSPIGRVRLGPHLERVHGEEDCLPAAHQSAGRRLRESLCPLCGGGESGKAVPGDGVLRGELEGSLQNLVEVRVQKPGQQHRGHSATPKAGAPEGAKGFCGGGKRKFNGFEAPQHPRLLSGDTGDVDADVVWALDAYTLQRFAAAAAVADGGLHPRLFEENISPAAATQECLVRHEPLVDGVEGMENRDFEHPSASTPEERR